MKKPERRSVECVVASCYSRETAAALSEALQEEARKVLDELLSQIRSNMKDPRTKGYNNARIQSRITNIEENGQPVCMLVFVSPSRAAVFIGPSDFIEAKTKDIHGQHETLLREGGGDGICIIVQHRKPKPFSYILRRRR